EPVTVEGYGFFARCLQHEVGHLDGFLYTDTLIGRNKRAAKKAFKAEGWNVEGNRTWLPGVDKDHFGHDDVGSAEAKGLASRPMKDHSAQQPGTHAAADNATTPHEVDTDLVAAAAGARRVPGLDFPLSRRTDPVSVRPGV